MERLYEGVCDQKYLTCVFRAFYFNFGNISRRFRLFIFSFLACLPGIICMILVFSFDLFEETWLWVTLGFVLFGVVFSAGSYLFFRLSVNAKPCKKWRRYVIYGDLADKSILSESDGKRKSIKINRVICSPSYIVVYEKRTKAILLPADERILGYLEENYCSLLTDTPSRPQIKQGN